MVSRRTSSAGERHAPLVSVYTDGACSGNPGPGGWGAVLIYNDRRREISGSEPLTTNNRMELRAAIEALRRLKRPCRVELYTDSEYLRRGMSEWLSRWKKNGWRTADRKPVKNADLWQELDRLSQIHDVHWHWLRGHTGHGENERADALARAAIDRRALKRSNE